jgi:hypothetical protein
VKLNAVTGQSAILSVNNTAVLTASATTLTVPLTCTFSPNATHVFGNTSDAAATTLTIKTKSDQAAVLSLVGYTTFRMNQRNDGSISFDDGATTYKWGQIGSTGSWTLGDVSNTPYSSYHVTNKNICSSTPSAATDTYGGLQIGANCYVASGRQPTRVANLGGAAIQLLPRTADNVDCIRFYANPAANAADYPAAIIASATQAGVWTIQNLAGTGSRAVNASATGELSAASDARLKQEDFTAHIPGLQEVLQLRPCAYKWLDDIEKRQDKAVTEIGFFANETVSIIPSSAPMGTDGYYGFYDRAVTAACVKAIQELKAENDSLKARIESLESK